MSEAPVVAHSDRPEDPDEVLAPGVTRRQATVLAAYASIVQGGATTPEREAERAGRGGLPISDPTGFEAMVQRYQQEVLDAIAEKADRDAAQDARDDEDLAAANDFGDADPSVIDVKKIRRYRELRDAEKAADAEKSAYKEEADRLEQELVDMFAEAGMQNLNVDGKTVYLHRSTYAQWAPGLDPSEKRRLLREAGAGDLVTETVAAATLAAYVRELCDVDDAPGLPEVLREHLELGERFAVRIIAGGTRKKSQTHSK